MRVMPLTYYITIYACVLNYFHSFQANPMKRSMH